MWREGGMEGNERNGRGGYGRVSNDKLLSYLGVMISGHINSCVRACVCLSVCPTGVVRWWDGEWVG